MIDPKFKRWSKTGQVPAPRHPARPPCVPTRPRRERPPATWPLPTLGLTAGQLAWLHTLAPGQRKRFDGLPIADKQRLLAPHQLGPNPDPILAVDARERIGGRD